MTSPHRASAAPLVNQISASAPVGALLVALHQGLKGAPLPCLAQGPRGTLIRPCIQHAVRLSLQLIEYMTSKIGQKIYWCQEETCPYFHSAGSTHLYGRVVGGPMLVNVTSLVLPELNATNHSLPHLHILSRSTFRLEEDVLQDWELIGPVWESRREVSSAYKRGSEWTMSGRSLT